MKPFRMQHLLVVGLGIVALVAIANGYGLLVFLLACPLLMMFMHRGMGHSHRGDDSARDTSDGHLHR